MIAFYGHVGRAPRTLTTDEQARLLAATARDPRDLRDHVIFSVALGTGLREHEILGLDCGDVYDREGRCRRRVVLRVFKGNGSRLGIVSDGDPAQVLLSGAAQAAAESPPERPTTSSPAP